MKSNSFFNVKMTLEIFKSLQFLKKGWFLGSLFLLFAGVVPSMGAFNMDIAGHSAAFGVSTGRIGTFYTLSWDAVEPSTTDAKVTYYVFDEFGLDGVSWNSTANFPLATISTLETEVTFSDSPGSRCFVVMSSDSFSGGTQTSDQECHSFIHDGQTEGLPTRTDGDGSQTGFEQKWEFSYSLDHDAYVTAEIYPPGTTRTLNANSFTVSVGSQSIKRLVHRIARPGEGSGHTTDQNKEQWDLRDSSGAVVPNGIYFLNISAEVDSGQFNGSPPAESPVDATPETLLRDSKWITIPVDVLRITDLETTGITLTNSTSLISYKITGDSLVRIVIAQPGSGFTLDGNGDIQPFNLTGGAIDTSLIVSTFSFQRKAGSNVESWNGVSSSGTVMPSGVYQVGISARDEFGNRALDSSLNDFPVFATLTLERSAGSNSGTTTQTDTTDPTLVSVTPANGAILSSAFSTITIVGTDSESPMNLSATVVTLLDPNSNAVANTLTTNAGNASITAVTNSLQTTNGTYQLSFNLVDNAGNSANFSTTFSLLIGLAAGDFEANTKVYPNPAKGGSTTIAYTLSVASTVKIEIFNILGERVYDETRSDTAGPQVVPWLLKNKGGSLVGSGLYLVKITAEGGGNTVETVKKLVVIQ